MALPASGAISLANVNTELGVASNTTRSLNDAAVRSLFGKASGVISMSDGYGKSNSSSFTFSPTISANTANYNLRAAAVAAGWNGTTALNATVTINSGVIVYSASTATAAFDTGVTFPAGTSLKIVNNGTILGKGGAGAASATSTPGNAGGAGGPALKAQYATSVTNNGRIAGGGGGGGSGAYGNWAGTSYAPGGGGIGNGATGGGAGATAGTLTTAGSGGPAQVIEHDPYYGWDNLCGAGGAGGTYGAAGAAGTAATEGNGARYGTGGAGGAAGACTVGVANITWVATGTRNGALT